MAKREILAGATDQTIDVFIQDSSSTVGAGLTGLAFNTASLTCYYRKGATGTPTALTLATQTVGGAHSDGGFVAVDGTNCPGQYRLDLSDTIVATAGMVTLYLRGATNMAPCLVEIEVVSVNKFDSVRMGMTALPNAAADAPGGLPISDAGGLDLDAKLAATNEVTSARMGALTDWIDGGRLDLILDGVLADTGTDGVALPDGVITAAKIADNAIDLAALASDVKARLLSTTSVTRLDLSASTIIPGTVDNTAFTATTTILESDDITEATADHYNGRIIIFTSGALLGQATEITDYALSTGRGRLTYTALTEAPSDDMTFIII